MAKVQLRACPNLADEVFSGGAGCGLSPMREQPGFPACVWGGL